MVHVNFFVQVCICALIQFLFKKSYQFSHELSSINALQQYITNTDT